MQGKRPQGDTDSARGGSRASDARPADPGADAVAQRAGEGAWSDDTLVSAHPSERNPADGAAADARTAETADARPRTRPNRTRTFTVTLRLDEREWHMLMDLIDELGITLSAALREALEDMHRKHLGKNATDPPLPRWKRRR